MHFSFSFLRLCRVGCMCPSNWAISSYWALLSLMPRTAGAARRRQERRGTRRAARGRKAVMAGRRSGAAPGHSLLLARRVGRQPRAAAAAASRSSGPRPVRGGARGRCERPCRAAGSAQPFRPAAVGPQCAPPDRPGRREPRAFQAESDLGISSVW